VHTPVCRKQHNPRPLSIRTEAKPLAHTRWTSTPQRRFLEPQQMAERTD
jgi:hypothetical protein